MRVTKGMDLLGITLTSDFYKTDKIKAPSSNKIYTEGHFNKAIQESFRETRRSQGLASTLNSRTGYVINKNSSYKVNPCFTHGKKQPDPFRVPENPNSPVRKTCDETVFFSLRSGKGYQRVNRNEMSVHLDIPDAKVSARQFQFKNGFANSLQARYAS